MAVQIYIYLSSTSWIFSILSISIAILLQKMSDDLPDPLSTNDEEDILEEFVDYPQLSNRAESDSGNSDLGWSV